MRTPPTLVNQSNPAYQSLDAPRVAFPSRNEFLWPIWRHGLWRRKGCCRCEQMLRRQEPHLYKAGLLRIWRVGLGSSESSFSDREKLVSVNDRSGETLCVATPYVLHMPTDAASAKAQKRMSEKSASRSLLQAAANDWSRIR